MRENYKEKYELEYERNSLQNKMESENKNIQFENTNKEKLIQIKIDNDIKCKNLSNVLEENF